MFFKEKYREAGISGKTALLFSTWFGSGLFPVAPGTFGTLMALPVVIIALKFGIIFESILLIVVVPTAIIASDISRKLIGKDDPSEVVIDEVVGMLLSLFLLPLSWISIVSGFLFFRFFDIFKPFPIGMIDKRLKGGLGIVLDDLLAGVYANICVRCLLFFFD